VPRVPCLFNLIEFASFRSAQNEIGEMEMESTAVRRNSNSQTMASVSVLLLLGYKWQGDVNNQGRWALKLSGGIGEIPKLSRSTKNCIFGAI